MDAIYAPPGAADPLSAYRARLAAGELATDPAQALAAERLQQLWSKLRGYDPEPHNGASGLLARWFRRPLEGAPENRPHGLYLVGEVGRGKSMLMDLFFAAAEVPRKRRVHFHEFMQEVHARIHAWHRAHPDGADPIPLLADAIAAEAALLCFDEFQVTDVADAMILGRLFAALFERGVVVAATSNTPPDELFKGQPGRDAFLPFIALLKQHLDVLVMEPGPDWRRWRLRGLGLWHVPADARAARALDEAFAALAGGAESAPETLTVLGRRLIVPRAAGGVARFDFATLCAGPFGPADYLLLATHYHALLLDGVPRLSPDERNEARRFMTLIDTLYEHRVKLVASADAPPDELYPADEGAAAFARTASRLHEMQTERYLALPHLT
jgi:cell division protein ZapE